MGKTKVNYIHQWLNQTPRGHKNTLNHPWKRLNPEKTPDSDTKEKKTR